MKTPQVYKITFEDEDGFEMSYIGSSMNGFDERFKGHLKKNGCKRIHNALMKHGPDNFRKEIYLKANGQDVFNYFKDDFENKTELACKMLVALEKHKVIEEGTLTPNGYNLVIPDPFGSLGNGERHPVYGKHFKRTEIQKQNLSKALKGKIPWNKGIPQTEEEKKKNSLGHLGKLSPRKGTKLSTETKTKISEKLKGRTPWIKGKHHTKETIEKFSKANTLPLDISKILELRKQGFSNRKIAKQLNCSNGTINNRIKKLKLKNEVN